MFKIEAGKKYVCRNGSVVTLEKRGRTLLTGNGWVFDRSSFYVNCYRVFHHREHHYDIVAPYVEKKSRKASSPYKKLLTAKEGDVFILKGEKFVIKQIGDSRVYLTNMYRKNPKPYQSIHVRNKNNTAVFNRTELIDLLRSGKYIIE